MTFLIQLYDFFRVNKVTSPFKASLSHAHTNTHTHTLSLTHTYTLSLSLSLSLSHTHTHTHTHARTHTHTHRLWGHKQNKIRNKRIHSQISNSVVFIWNLLHKKVKINLIQKEQQQQQQHRKNSFS